MTRSIVALAIILAVAVATGGTARAGAVTRTRLSGDVYRYDFVVPVGSGPNAQLHIHRVVRERAPFFPRPSQSAIMMLHGDFSTFITNFTPMATWLAQRGIDVWGVDRRWANTPAGDGALSDFGDMGIVQELADVRAALGFARGVRILTDASLQRMTLAGFSRGGQIAYAYASDEAARPAAQRHLKGLVPLDVYLETAPEDDDLRQNFCFFAEQEYEALAEGFIDTPNDLQILIGQNDLTAPDEPNPFPGFFGPLTNHEVFLFFVGQTAIFFPATPFYHLNATQILDGSSVAITESPEPTVAAWLAGAAPHQSMREAADTDALVCGQGTLPVDVPLARIRVPLFLIAAAGGYGDHAIYSTTQVSSTDVTTLVIRRLPVAREAEDFGHADILFARDAATLAWQPLLSWLRARQ